MGPVIGRQRICHSSWIWSIFFVAILLVDLLTSAFSPISSGGIGVQGPNRAVIQTSGHDEARLTSLHARRRDILQSMPMAILVSYVTTPSSSLAAEDVEALPTQATVTECFDAIRYELKDQNGGVAYMQGRIDQEDFVGLLEFTKTYDLELR
jgi:hypothetical protein